MLSTSTPPKFPLSWAQNAAGIYTRSIPTNSQIGVQNGAASLNDGFPPLTFTPEDAGGVPPFGQDFNGVLHMITLNDQWTQAGGQWTYDAAFATAIGGYQAGAVLASAVMPGRLWYNTIENNTQNPDVFPFTGWITPAGMVPPGTPIPSFSATVLPGCVLANGLTIGNTGSGGTTAPTALASPTAFFLFCAIWFQFPQTICPTQFNGAAVARGANPLADWTAGRVIVTPGMAGAGLIGQDNMGGVASANLAGVPVGAGSSTTPGSIVGEDVHTLTLGELATGIAVNVGVSVSGSISGFTDQAVIVGQAGNVIQSGTVGQGVQVHVSGTFSGSGSGSGNSTNTGGAPHNNVERSFTVAWNLSL